MYCRFGHGLLQCRSRTGQDQRVGEATAGAGCALRKRVQSSPRRNALAARAEKSARPFEYACDIEVRDYELDQFGVLCSNFNASCLPACSSCLHPAVHLRAGRHKFLQSINIDADAIARSGNALAISELTLKFRAPLRASDMVKCTCKCISATSVRINLEQKLVKLPSTTEEKEQTVLEAAAVVVSLDRQYKPRKVHQEVLEAMMTGKASDTLMGLLA